MSSAPDLTHARFGGDFRYTILKSLGDGGYAWVYQAMDHRLGREVAIKFLQPLATTEEEEDEEKRKLLEEQLRERFEQEAQICARLNSRKHIVDVFDFGTCEIRGEEYHYISMEMLKGETLFDRLQERGALSLEEVYTLLMQVGIALKEAHSYGLIHRDLKPENLMLLEDEGMHVVVLDFGIAKVVEKQDAEAARRWRQNLTTQGDILCSPIYAAPEQIRSEELGGYTDLYALGLVAYEALTRSHPYRDPATGQTLSMYQFLARTITDPSIRLPTQHQAARSSLAPIIHALLEKDVTLRIQTAKELLERLESLNMEDPSQPSTRMEGEPTTKLTVQDEHTERLPVMPFHKDQAIATQDLSFEANRAASGEFERTRGIRPALFDPLEDKPTFRYEIPEGGLLVEEVIERGEEEQTLHENEKESSHGGVFSEIEPFSPSSTPKKVLLGMFAVLVVAIFGLALFLSQEEDAPNPLPVRTDVMTTLEPEGWNEDRYEVRKQEELPSALAPALLASQAVLGTSVAVASSAATDEALSQKKAAQAKRAVKVDRKKKASSPQEPVSTPSQKKSEKAATPPAEEPVVKKKREINWSNWKVK